jgi:dihydrofolate synthase/folylpolyglutamate synthase
MIKINSLLDELYSKKQDKIKYNLKNIKHLAMLLSNPEKKFSSIHIAGTNGKGSTAAIIESILRNSGYKTGLFTSPHLVHYNERILINGKPISNNDIVNIYSSIKQKIENYWQLENLPSFFELTTAIAFKFFSEQELDFAIIETGMGGRLDATNIIQPLLSIITKIDYDHTKTLGNTIEKICYEKAGIIKKNTPLLFHNNDTLCNKIISSKALEKNARIINHNHKVKINLLQTNLAHQLLSIRLNGANIKVKFPLLGKHQLNNLLLALKAALFLRSSGYCIDDESILQGLKNVDWNGRCQIINNLPLVIIDGAHNSDGVKSLVKFLNDYKLNKKKKSILIFGVLRDKPYKQMLEMLLPFFKLVILTEPANERKLNASELAKILIGKNIKFKVIAVPEDAYNYALKYSDKNDFILITGSLYLVGEILKSALID